MNKSLIFTIYRKELSYYFNSSVGYIAIALFAVFANFLFMKDIFLASSASMRTFFATLPWLMMIFVPALSMRSIAEEKRSNTIETLLSLPISETQIVVAKFFALLTVVSIGLGLTLSVPLWLAQVSALYIPEIIVAYLGIVLFASALVSLSMFFSSQTSNQVVAFLFSVIATFFLLVLSTQFVSSVVPKGIQDSFMLLAPINHMDYFSKGLIDIRSIVYFVSFTLVFLFLTVVDMEKRN